jgi:hypothetical protein
MFRKVQTLRVTAHPRSRRRKITPVKKTRPARFLILPHLRVPNLASAILARAARQLPADWQDRYGYAPVLLETFVDTNRFTGASYRAANWIWAGYTKGRGKLDRHHQHAQPVKEVYLYPLDRHYQRILTNG